DTDVLLGRSENGCCSRHWVLQSRLATSLEHVSNGRRRPLGAEGVAVEDLELPLHVRSQVSDTNDGLRPLRDQGPAPSHRTSNDHRGAVIMDERNVLNEAA